MIGSEDDLFRLFGGDDPNQPGLWQRSFRYLQMAIASTGPHGTKNKQIKLKDQSRHYLLKGSERMLRVDQSRLIKVGKAMRDPELMVQYLGSAGIVETE